MKCSVFVPSHITGFFEIIDHENPLKKGSRGAGVVMDKGVITKIKIKDGNGLNIKINGKNDPYNVTITKKVIEIMKKDFNLDNKKIEIEHDVQLPIGAGFGTSAAFAIGTALCISKTLKLPLTFNKAVQIAHIGEVKMKSGLGDVIAEINGGITLRLKEGAPGIGITDKLVLDESEDLFVISKIFGEIKTSDIIGDPFYKDKINFMGKNLLLKLINNPTPQNFMNLSRKFAENTGLMSKEVLETVKIFEEETLGASMAMLGNTAFSISNTPDTSVENVIISKIYHDGCKFL
ncbi:MAG: GHMP kinase [Methanobacterium sp.]|uniref:pantoate kinase n=1 Tax=Methanobacterium sp. TaxID=2164 RepID=UPI003D65968C|nr:GHMP kinase [Methanobacterium sp.]